VLFEEDSLYQLQEVRWLFTLIAAIYYSAGAGDRQEIGGSPFNSILFPEGPGGTLPHPFVEAERSEADCARFPVQHGSFE
jgi:hypothetical protein